MNVIDRKTVIQDDEEFDRLAAELEALDAIEEDRELQAEEREVQTLLAHLCTEYKFLMEQNGLRPVDLVAVLVPAR